MGLDTPLRPTRAPDRADVRRRGLLAVAAALLGLATAAVALGVLRSAASSGQPRPGENVFVNPPAVIDANNTPTIVRNPRDSGNLVVVHRVDRPGFSAAVRASDDGGRTWRSAALPLPPGKDRPYAPDAAFARDGTLYLVYANLTGPGNVPENLWLARSTDSGRSFSAPVRVAGELSFQPRLVVAPDGTLHITYLQVDSVGLLAIAGPARIVAVSSTDGGQSFSAPVRVSDPDRERVGAAVPLATADGELLVLYEDFKGDVRDFQNLDGPVWQEPFALVLTRSTDGGRSFGQGLELESQVVPTRRFLVFLPPFPAFATGQGGSLYVAWTDGRHGDEDVLLRRSPDGGRTWSAPVRVHGNAVGDGTSQYLPQVAVAPDGRVDVLFYDRRRDPQDVLTDVFLASSSDQAASFSEVRVSSSSFDSRVGPIVGPTYLEPDFGSRLGLVSADGEAIAAWTDTRLGDDATGRQDIVAASVTIPGAGARGSGLVLVAGGLLCAGAMLLLLRRRRRAEPGEEA